MLLNSIFPFYPCQNCNNISLLSSMKKKPFQINHLIKKIISKIFTTETAIALIALFGGLIIRILAIPYQSGDYINFLLPWGNHLKLNGVWTGFTSRFADYNMPYLYLMGLLSLTPIPNLGAIKLLSILFDLFLAFLVYKFVSKHTLKHFGNSKMAGLLAGVCILFSPTVILNGSVWAQCDSIFTFFCVLGVYYLAKKKDFLGAFYFSLGFCFKIQAMFLLPAIFIILCKRNPFKIFYLSLFPILYFIFALPAYFQGRSVPDLITIYGQQAGGYKNLNSGGIGFWAFFTNNGSLGDLTFQIIPGGPYLQFNELFGGIATISAFSIMAIFTLLCIKYIKKITPELIISISLFSTLVFPYLLPRMHERYWFLADIFSIIYAWFNPKQWYVAIIINLISFMAYLPFLFQYKLTAPIPEQLFPIILAAPIYLIGNTIFKQIKSQQI